MAEFDPLSEAIKELAFQRLDGAALNKALIVVGLAPLSFMIDNGTITAEQAVQRLEQLRDRLLPETTDARARLFLAPLIETLRTKVPKAPDQWTPTVHQGGRSDPDPGD